jgi:hypothetical protein
VDEVAAAHLNADGVIHFGHTCLTLAQVTIPRYTNCYNQGKTARLVIENMPVAEMLEAICDYQCCESGSGIGCLFDPGMGKKSGSGYGMNNQDHTS